MSGEDTTGRDASGGRGADGDEAAWRDLIARFEMPLGQQDAAPWPDRESLTPHASGSQDADTQTADPETSDTAASDTAASDTAASDTAASDTAASDTDAADPDAVGPRRGADRARVIRPAAPPLDGISVPLPPANAANAASGANGANAANIGPDQADAIETDETDADLDEEEHFVPPPPPPLPHLDSVAKGAWTALFGGPAYLLAATLLGWVVPGWAALLAVIAFVGGFAVVALRLGDRPSDDAGPDDGAVL